MTELANEGQLRLRQRSAKELGAQLCSNPSRLAGPLHSVGPGTGMNLFITGCASDDLPHNSSRGPVLQKPFAISKLKDAIDIILAERLHPIDQSLMRGSV
jgi:hypothetical protein